MRQFWMITEENIDWKNLEKICQYQAAIVASVKDINNVGSHYL